VPLRDVAPDLVADPSLDLLAEGSDGPDEITSLGVLLTVGSGSAG
jgi:hypothetical protein